MSPTNQAPPSHFLYDSRTAASSPGGVRLDWRHYLRCYPTLPLALLGVVVVAVVVSLSPLLVDYKNSNIATTVAVAVALIVVVLGAIQLRMVPVHMYRGCICPAVVIDPEGGLIAVYTDLTRTSSHKFPVIKVLRAPLRRATNKPLLVGDRLSTVSLYAGDGMKGDWDNFFPIPTVCATMNEVEIRRTLSSISSEEWQKLQVGLSRLGPRPKRGLHRISTPL